VLGFYGPDSQMWRVNREAVLLGAGPAALLLQLAHPLVAEGVAAHSGYPDDAWGRLARTLRTTMDMVFGDGPSAERAVRRLNGVHRGVRGPVLDAEARSATQRESYQAMDPALLLWVQATLVVLSVRAYVAWVGPLDATARDGLWQEAREVGVRLGIPLRASPSSWPRLLRWFDEQLGPNGPIVVTDTARALAPAIVRPPIRWLPSAMVGASALPGLALLPASIRDAYGIRWSAPERRLSNGLSVGIRMWVAVMPRSLRSMPQARAADRRVASQIRTSW
jgi:uncharacterized protein (DUF2236 family)